MEAGRDAVGDGDGCDGWFLEAGGVEDHEVGCLGLRVDDIAHEPALVLGGGAGPWHEDELARHAAFAEVVDLARALLEIVLQAAGRGLDEGVGRQRDRVGIAIGLADACFVGAREFLRVGVDHAAGHLACGGVDGPALEGNTAGVGTHRAVGKHGVVRADVEDDLAVRRLVAIAGVVDIAGVDIAPDDVGAPALARQQADAGLVFRVPGIGEGVTCEKALHREGDRQVEDDHVAPGDHAVVDHGAVLHGDGFLAPHAAIAADDNVADGVEAWALVADRVHLARVGVEMRVRGEAALERAAKGIVGDGLELGAHAHGKAAGLGDRPRAAGMRDDVGVDGLEEVAWAGCGGLAQRGADRGASDPAVAIPLGLAAPEAHAVDHAVTHEPVIGGRVRRLDRVGSDAHIGAVEFSRDRACHLEGGQRLFRLHRRMYACEEGIDGIVAHQAAPDGSDCADRPGHACTHDRFNGTCHVFLLSLET